MISSNDERIDQAKQALHIAQQSIEQHNYDKAVRFLEKITQRFMTDTEDRKRYVPDTDRLLSMCRKKLSGEGDDGGDFGAKRQSSSSSSSSTAAKSSKRRQEEEEAEEAEITYTREEVEDVNYVMKHKGDYYRVLRVEKTSTTEQIRRAYKKQAMKVHPDRCKAPNATEAFKVVAAAFTCLSDESKRRMYDEYGTDNPQQQRPSFHDIFGGGGGGGGYNGNNRRRQGGHQTFFDADEIDPNEIFAQVFSQMFFGGAAPPGGGGLHARRFAAGGGGGRGRARSNRQPPTTHNSFSRYAHHAEEQDADGDAPGTLNLGRLFLLPMIILFLFSALSSLFTSNGVGVGNNASNGRVSFVQTDRYSVPQESTVGGFEYFVDPAMAHRLNAAGQWDRKQFDNDLYKREYKQHLHSECGKQIKTRQETVKRAQRLPADSEQRKKLLDEAYSEELIEACTLYNSQFGFA